MAKRDYRKIYTVKGIGLLRKWGIDPSGVDGGNIKIKPVNCGKKNCKTCPHRYYAYHRNRWGEKYLGVCDENGNPREKYEPAPGPLKQTLIPGTSKKILGKKKTPYLGPF